MRAKNWDETSAGNFGHQSSAAYWIIAAFALFVFSTAPRAFSQSGDSVTGAGAATLPLLTPGVDSRQVSPENPTGGKAKGALSSPDPKNPDLAFSGAASGLGRGWKVRPFVEGARTQHNNDDGRRGPRHYPSHLDCGYLDAATIGRQP